MKMSKEDLKAKVGELVEDNTKSIELLEAIEDSFVEPDTTEYDNLKKDYDNLKTNYDELENKYKNRFLEGKPKEKEEEKPEELKEEKIVDVKEI